MVPDRTPPIRASLDDVLQRAFVVELGIVVALVLGFYAFTIAVDTVLDPYFLDSDTTLLALRSAFVLAGIGLLATTYASWRGHSLPTSFPDRSDGWLVGGAVVGAAVLGTVPFLMLASRTGVGVAHVGATLSDPVGVFGGRTLVRTSLFVAGMVLLYHGLAQEALQRVFDRGRDLTVVTTTLLGGYLVAPTVITYGTFANGPWLSLWGARAAVAVLFVLALGVAVYAEERTADDRARALTVLPVLVTLALAGLVLSVEAASLDGILVTTTRTGVVGVAAYTYDRTQSLAPPVLVYAAFAVVSTALYSATVTAALGA